MPKIKYKTFDLRTTEGFDAAERHQALGWKVGSVGFHTIQMYKETTNDKHKRVVKRKEL